MTDAEREQEIMAAVRAEYRAGGRPLARYNELHAVRHLSPFHGALLTTEIIRNLEDRLVELEAGSDDGGRR